MKTSMSTATLLGRLLAELGLTSHADFVREYRRAALAVGSAGAGPGPSRAQWHRWLTGRIEGVPQPHHRRVLEAMFPGRSARELLTGTTAATPAPAGAPALRGVARPALPAGSARLLGIHVTVFPDRGALLAAHPVESLLAGAERVRAAGVALDLLCRSLPLEGLTSAVRAGAVVECLLLDPGGRWSRRRSCELGHGPAYLAGQTRLSLDHLGGVRRRLGDPLRDRVTVALYDEPPRYSLLLLDDDLAVVQSYLPHAPGARTPVVLLDARAGAERLHAVYERVFDELLDVSVPP
jgi:hypothetical protein